MSVLIEVVSVVVRNKTLEAKYPCGVEGYWRDCPNATFCGDDHLSCVAFMVPGDADAFVAQLAAKGLMPHRSGAAEDVALVSANEGLLRPCSWLELGRWGPAPLAWMAGTKPGDLHAPAGWSAERGARYMSAEQIKERLEFVRSERNIEVYCDRATGEEFYVGRTHATSDQHKARHDELYRQACGLIEGLLITGNDVPGQLDAPSRGRLEQAIGLYMQVVQINPGNWAAMWLVGKIYQRLVDNEQSLMWFSRAHRVNPDHPDVAREAALAAMELERAEEAVTFCQRALDARPDDAGLRANLALALLFSGNPRDAQAAAREALAQDPADRITANIAGIIEEVMSGKRRCPRHVREMAVK